MAIDPTDILTGLLTPTQRSQQQMGNNLTQASLGNKGSLLASLGNIANSFTDSLSNLVGADTRSDEQIMGEKVSGLLQKGDEASLNEAVQLLAPTHPELSARLIGKINQQKEEEALTTKTEAELEASEEQQRGYLIERFGEDGQGLANLVGTDVPFSSLVTMGQGQGLQGITQADMVAMFVAQGIPVEVAARLAAKAYNARDPDNSAEQPTFEPPNNAMIEAVSNFVDQMDITDITDQYGKVPWDSGINNYTKDDFKNEVAYVGWNLKQFTIPQITDAVNKYYSDNPEASANDFTRATLGASGVSPTQANDSTDGFTDIR